MTNWWGTDGEAVVQSRHAIPGGPVSELHPYQPRGGDIALCTCGRFEDDAVHTEAPAAVAARDAEIRAFLERNPHEFARFVRRDMHRDPAWWTNTLRKWERTYGIRRPR